jgi:hypothetical protein
MPIGLLIIPVTSLWHPHGACPFEGSGCEKPLRKSISLKTII